MAGSISFLAGGYGLPIINLNGSGLGLYGQNFGYSIPVGSYNQRTFCTDSTGTVQGNEVNNNQWQSTSGVIVGQLGSGTLLQRLPNYMSTLNIRLTNSTPCQTQNCKLYGYDRVNPNNPPSGVTCYGAVIIHPNTVQDLSGSGSPLWILLSGSGSYLSLPSSPGTSGLSPNGPSTQDTQHDSFVSITASPNSVGSKLWGLYVYMEYM